MVVETELFELLHSLSETIAVVVVSHDWVCVAYVERWSA
jgi:ABC-type lipoprotein export system ATPase subunit